MINAAARTVNKEVMDIVANESRECCIIHAVHRIKYMGKGMDSLRKRREEFDPDNQGIVIPTQVWWVANPSTLRERRQNGLTAR
jgi:hypothetical protein